MPSATPPVNLASLAPGTPVRLTIDALVAEHPRTGIKGLVAPNGSGVRVPTSWLRAASSALEIRGPKWQPGDVVVVRYALDGTPYTYVRGLNRWPGENAADKTDADITRLFGEGKVEHVLRDGKPVEARDDGLAEWEREILSPSRYGYPSPAAQARARGDYRPGGRIIAPS